MGRAGMAAGAVLAVVATAAAGAPTRPTLAFHTVARGLPRLNGIVWTGRRFLYVENTLNTVWSAPPSGAPVRRIATMPRLVEETRCVLSPGAHGFPADAVFCHSPDHKIYELAPDGKLTLFATLPAAYPPAGDGALAFDRVGRFGFRLLAATGRSGASRPSGGAVYAVDAAGIVQRIGRYPGPGGADELAVAPAGFGSAGGDVLLTVDAGASGGALVAVDPAGVPRAIASFPDGPNPIVVIPGRTFTRTRPPAPGIYLTDDLSHVLYHAPIVPLARFAGDVLVGSERFGRFWVVAPSRDGFTELPVRTTLGRGTHSLEAMIVVR
jgi:hypothetical protein